MAEDTTRDDLEALLHQFNINWRACGHAEDRRNTALLNELNTRHRYLIKQLAQHEITFNDLDYDRDTSTFSIPERILAMAST